MCDPLSSKTATFIGLFGFFCRQDKNYLSGTRSAEDAECFAAFTPSAGPDRDPGRDGGSRWLVRDANFQPAAEASGNRAGVSRQG